MAVSLMSLKLSVPIGRIPRWMRWSIKAVVTAVVVIVVAGRFDAGAGFFWGILAACLVGLFDARVAVAAGLIALASCPLLLLAEQYAWLQQSTIVSYYAASLGIVTFSGAADVVAVWAYYLLCISVLALLLRSFFIRIPARLERATGKTVEIAKGLAQDAQQTHAAHAV